MAQTSINAVARRYRSRWLQGYARGKLTNDPIFAAAYELLRECEQPLLDVGCGIGLLASYLRARGFREAILGVDFDAGKIESARQAADGLPDVTFAVRSAEDCADFRGSIVLVDVLHYLTAERQVALLEQLADQVAPGGCCLIRATPRDESWRFRVTRWEEWFLRASGWMKSGAIHYATIPEIIAPFEQRGFQCEARPLWGRTPFNSYLFVMRLGSRDPLK